MSKNNREVEFGRGTAGRQAVGTDHVRVQFARVAHHNPVGRKPRTAAGVPGCVNVGFDLQRDTHGICDRLGQSDGIGPVDGSGRTPPTGLRPITAQHQAEMFRLPGQRRQHLLDHGLRWPTAGGSDRSAHLGEVTENLPVLIQVKRFRTPRDVASSDGQQAGEQGGAHQWLLVVQRVRQSHRRAAGVVVRQAQRIEVRRTQERIAEHFHQAQFRGTAPHLPQKAVLGAQPDPVPIAGPRDGMVS